MTLTKKYQGIYIDDSVQKEIISSDGIIFDCDGVLIDITKSYDLTIEKTVNYFLKNIFNIDKNIKIDSKIIDGFKSSGGFNDEVDLTYVLILCIIFANRIDKDEIQVISDVIEHSDTSGIISVEKYIQKHIDIKDVKLKLQYPRIHHESQLYQIFDQFFYGSALYTKLFKRDSSFPKHGLIDNDVVLVNRSLIKKLNKKFKSKIAMVTGRGKESVRYSLKEQLEQFDVKNSAFLEDESRNLAKPNPESLIRSIKGMKIKHCIYVGDSMEDFIMAKKATEQGFKTTFCGIIGTSKRPDEKLKLFQSKEAVLILKSINLLPKVLNLETNKVCLL